MIILNQNYKLDEILTKNEVLLVHADDFSDDHCNDILEKAEVELLSISEEKKLKKRLFHILVESLQNLTRHGEVDNIKIGGNSPLIVMGKHKESPYILTANPIANGKINELKKRIDQINEIGYGELKKLYRETLKEGNFNKAGGANLGLIDIVRKAGGQLQYGFDRIDESHSYFILKININSKT